MTPDVVRRHTRLRPVPGVPALRLYLGEDIVGLWQSMAEQSGEADAPPPYWAFAWAGGQGVARYVLEHWDEVSGRRVLDLAAGSGLCAIAAAWAGAREVLAVDIDPISGSAVALNAAANGTVVSFALRDPFDSDPPAVDVITAGDVLYERAMAARAFAWLSLAHERGVRVLVGDPGRPYLPRERLTCLAEYQIPTMRDLEDSETKCVGVYTFSSRAGSTRPC